MCVGSSYVNDAIGVLYKRQRQLKGGTSQVLVWMLITMINDEAANMTQNGEFDFAIATYFQINTFIVQEQ